jgi:hypothetical protein
VQRDAFMHVGNGVFTILDLLHLPDRLRPKTGWRDGGNGCKMCKIAVSRLMHTKYKNGSIIGPR